MYVAKRQLKVGDDIRQIGDPIPEAEEWLRVESWVRFGFIEDVEGDYPVEKPQVQRRK